MNSVKVLLTFSLAFLMLHYVPSKATPLIDCSTLSYEQIRAKAQSLDVIGMETHINLDQCNMERIRTKPVIEDYLVRICPMLGIHPFDRPVIKHRSNSHSSGFSFTFLTEEGVLWGEFINKKNSAFIRIFCHKLYNPEAIALYTKSHFGATGHTMKVTLN